MSVRESAQLVTLAALFCSPRQRLVHQLPYERQPEAVFFREPRLSGQLTPPGGIETFRAMLDAGWIVRVNAHGGGSYGFQDEYQVAEAAKGRFDSDPDWMLAESVYRDQADLKPRLRAIAGTASGPGR